MTHHKSRKEKAREYEIKYKDIPKNFDNRLDYMINKFNLTEKKMDEIVRTKNNMIKNMYYKDLLVILYEEPEGTPRPRFRIINRKNLFNSAIKNKTFVHVYSLNAHEDNMYMQRLSDTDIIGLDSLLYTPCIVTYNIFVKTPSSFNIKDKFLAEIGLIRPISKPDWDNIGKKYSDMYTSNIWVDDTLVITGTVNKYYSILPRVEIKLKYLNGLYNKYQYNSMKKKFENRELVCLEEDFKNEIR